MGLLDVRTPDELRAAVGPLTVCRAADPSLEVRAEERAVCETCGHPALDHEDETGACTVADCDCESYVEPDGEDDAARAARAAGDHVFTGHAAVFDRLSDPLSAIFYTFRERIMRGAFRKALDEDQDVVFLFDHEGLPLARTSARTLELREDPRGLFSYARWARSYYSDAIATAVGRGDLKQMSFAFTVAEDEWIERNSEDDEEPEIERVIHKIDRLYDVSVVSQPAYPQTDGQMRSREIEKVARRIGLPVAPAIEQLARSDGTTPQLPPTGPGGAGDGEDPARGVGLSERDRLQAEAKRRLAIAQAKTTTKG